MEYISAGLLRYPVRLVDAGNPEFLGKIGKNSRKSWLLMDDDDLKRAFRRLEKVFQAEEGTAQADERDVLVTLVGAYENNHYDFGPADPAEAIKFRMEQGGLTPRDLEPFIGPSGRVSEVLNRKRPLSLRMVKRLHDGLKIPYESLLTEVS